MNYTQAEIKEIIKNYYYNVQILEEYEPEPMKSVGVSVMSSQPSGGNISDQVADAALLRVSNESYYTDLAKGIKFLEQRFYKITDSTDLSVFRHRLDGYTVTEISAFLGMGRRTIYDRIDKIARTINRTN